MAIIPGGPGADTLAGTADVDTIQAFGGADSLVGGQGADTLDGGAGFDFVDYIDDSAGVDVDIGAGTARDGWGAVDRLIDIEHVRGSFLDDVIRGDEGYNYLDGEDGDDTLNARYGDDGLRGGGGNDVLIGGGLFDLDDPAAFAEYDFADYRGTANAVVVDLANGTVYGGAGAGNDVLIGVESARGSAFADTFYGGSGADFEGFVGGGGDDRIHGDGVTNTRAEYWDATGGVTITLDAAGNGTATGAGIGTDALFDVNFIRGSSFADRFDAHLFANGVDGGTFNHFQGDGGDDTVVGNGDTRIDFRSATIGVTVDLVVGTAADGLGGVDTFHGVDQVRGSGFADTLRGGVDDDYEGFEGRAGDDRIDGRAGFDEAIYSLDGVPSFGITVDLAAGIVVGDPATSGTDTLISVEAMRGTIVDDLFDATRFAGGDAPANGPGTAIDPRFNVFEGMAGDDTVVGNGRTAISYVHAVTGVTVTFTAAGEGGSSGDYHTGADVFTGVEGVLGSDADDTFIGSDDPSGPGHGYFEFFAGNGGNDHIDGGGGVDMAHYGWATEGVVVDLGAGSASGGASTGTDVLVDIEAVHGSRFDDTLRGGSAAAYEFFVGGGGDDVIDGLGGRDIVSFFSDAAGVVVDLDDQSNNRDGSGGVDTYIDVEEYEGSGFADTMRGGAGDDLFRGAGGDDSLDGGAGGDTLYGGAGSDLLDGGADEDVVDYRANDSRIVGGAISYPYGGSTNIVTEAFGDIDTLIAIETVFATDHDDTFEDGFDVRVVFGGDGGDIIAAGGLDNTLHGDGGDDSIYGGFGGDSIFGGDGWDELYGGDGDDYFVSGFGSDYIDGGADEDVVDYSGEPGPVVGSIFAVLYSGSTNIVTEAFGDVDSLIAIETVLGSDYDDTFWDGFDVRVIDGRWGRDTIVADALENTIFGGGDDDTISGGLGDDSLYGDGGGRDWVDYRTAWDAVTVDLDTGEATIEGTGEFDVLGGFEAVFGSDHDDTIRGAWGFTFETFVGGDGDDIIDGRPGGYDAVSYEFDPGSVTIDLWEGTAVDGYGATDTLSDLYYYVGSAFDDTMSGQGPDIGGLGVPGPLAAIWSGVQFFGLDGNDTLTGGDGDDVLDGGSGDDTMTGGYGDDVYVVDGAGDVVIEFSEEGHDTVLVTVDYTLDIALEDLRAVAFGDFTLTGNANDNEIQGISYSFPGFLVGNETLRGLAGADTLFGFDGDDALDGGFDDDSLYGGDGNDTIRFADAALTTLDVVEVTIAGGAGSATGAAGLDVFTGIEALIGGDEIDRFTGWDQRDTFDGGGGDDQLVGAGGDDTLRGGDGNDRLFGGAGNDTLTGGYGDDFYRLDDGDIVDETSPGTAGHDTVWVSFTNYTLPDGVEVGAVNFAGPAILTGEGDRNTLFGDAAADTLFGLGGNDYLYGFASGDSLYGGLGDDFLFGGTGGDTLVGGGGNDYYRFDDAGADTVIEAIGDGVDQVWVGFSGHTMSANVEWGVLNFDGDGDLTGNAIDNTLYGTDGVNTLHGGGGNDNLLGYAGIDALYGEDGDDVLQGGLGADALYGGDGNDAFIGGGGAANTYFGGAGDDFYRIDAATDVVDETGGSGIDTVWVSLSVDYVATAGVEVIAANATVDMNLTGNAIDNLIQGNDGVNTLSGAGGNDTLQGFGGTDVLVGGAGRDILSGGSGADIFSYTLGDGNDVIVDFNFAEGDRVDLTGIVYIGNGATADVAILSADGGVTTFTLSANNGYTWTGAEFI